MKFRASCTQKSNIRGSQNHPQIDENPAPDRVHPAAPMVLQGGPQVPKWPPECSRGAKMASQSVKMEHQAPQMASPKSQGDGVALKTLPLLGHLYGKFMEKI